MARTLEPQKPMSSDAEMYSAEAFRLSREVQQNTRVELDVAYGPDEEQGLDIYLPALESSTPLPTLLFMHGGGWANGYKEWMGFMAPAITCLPAIFVSVGYRLVPRAQFPDQPNDCWDALKWVYDNIGRYGGDPRQALYRRAFFRRASGGAPHSATGRGPEEGVAGGRHQGLLSHQRRVRPSIRKSCKRWGFSQVSR